MPQNHPEFQLVFSSPSVLLPQAEFIGFNPFFVKVFL
jgi:hypothetical protein